MMSQELFDEAIRLEDDGQLDRALAVWRELALTDPTRNVFLRLAGCEQEIGITNDAERAFKQALEIDNRSALALGGLGSLAVDRGDFETAEDCLKRACAVDENARWFSLLGVALRNLGKDLDAEEAYRTAIRLDAKYEEA